MELASNDPVVSSLQRVPEILDGLPLTHLLANGKIEKQLKFFLAAAWVKAEPSKRVCLMDKKLNGRELDFLALEDAAPKFWLEMKCDFADKRREPQLSAHAALGQVFLTKDELAKEWRERRDRKFQACLESLDAFRLSLNACDVYIVHLLNCLPKQDDELLPHFIHMKYEPRLETAIAARELESHYTGNRFACTPPSSKSAKISFEYQVIGSRCIPMAKDDAPGSLSAVVVKLGEFKLRSRDVGGDTASQCSCRSPARSRIAI
jgi:hypothetical protein